ncbi:MAG: hypothetical protein K2X47_04075 [Bdellovibrionales bacterium]|nr:hypothetical protein [Bdellovibrionales bacterium]
MMRLSFFALVLTLLSVSSLRADSSSDCLAAGGVVHPFDFSCRLTNQSTGDVTIYRRPTSAAEQALAGNGGYIQTNWNRTQGITSLTAHQADGDLISYAFQGNNFGVSTVTVYDQRDSTPAFENVAHTSYSGSAYCALWNCRQGERSPPPKAKRCWVNQNDEEVCVDDTPQGINWGAMTTDND